MPIDIVECWWPFPLPIHSDDCSHTDIVDDAKILHNTFCGQKKKNSLPLGEKLTKEKGINRQHIVL